MDELKIVGWTDFESDYPSKKYDADTFNKIMGLIIQEISENNYVFSGEEHQNSMTGVPVFSDGTCFRASMRSWGTIMTYVYSGPNGEQLSDMDFYMTLKDSNLPEYKFIDVEPAVIDDVSIGCTTKQDMQVVSEAIAMDMMFMTTDKVLNKLYEQLKNRK